MQVQLQNLTEQSKDQAGTIETLERQLVQAGIKNKVMQASVEINKKKEEVKGGLQKGVVDNQAAMSTMENQVKNNIDTQNKQAAVALKGVVNDMQTATKSQENNSKK